ncbi:hypothetical protein D3C78_1427280 [compost metagenome]
MTRRWAWVSPTMRAACSMPSVRRGGRCCMLWASLARMVTSPCSSRLWAMSWAASPKWPATEEAVTCSRQPCSRKGLSLLGVRMMPLLRSGWAIIGTMLRCSSQRVRRSAPKGISLWGNSSSSTLLSCQRPRKGRLPSAWLAINSMPKRTSAAQLTRSSMPAWSRPRTNCWWAVWMLWRSLS